MADNPQFTEAQQQLHSNICQLPSIGEKMDKMQVTLSEILEAIKAIPADTASRIMYASYIQTAQGKNSNLGMKDKLIPFKTRGNIIAPGFPATYQAILTLGAARLDSLLDAYEVPDDGSMTKVQRLTSFMGRVQ